MFFGSFFGGILFLFFFGTCLLLPQQKKVTTDFNGFFAISKSTKNHPFLEVPKLLAPSGSKLPGRDPNGLRKFSDQPKNLWIFSFFEKHEVIS